MRLRRADHALRVADTGEQLEVKILGPLEVRRNGEVLALGGARQRSLLALLLLHRNEVIPRERLIDAIWEESPPATAVNALQVAVHGLRKLLGSARLRSRHGGYELVVEPGESTSTSLSAPPIARAVGPPRRRS